MKALALIMALTLLGGSVKGGPLVNMLKTTIGMGECSHGESTSKSCHDGNQESDNCCGDMGCECTCCIHIMILTIMKDCKFIKDPFAGSNPSYLWDYHRDHLATIFHPPVLG